MDHGDRRSDSDFRIISTLPLRFPKEMPAYDGPAFSSLPPQTNQHLARDPRRLIRRSLTPSCCDTPAVIVLKSRTHLPGTHERPNGGPNDSRQQNTYQGSHGTHTGC